MFKARRVTMTTVQDIMKKLKQKEDIIAERDDTIAQLKSLLEDKNRIIDDLNHRLNIRRAVDDAPPSPTGTRRDRIGISAEPQTLKTVKDVTLKRYTKGEKTKDLINRAIQENEFMKNLEGSQVREIIACMHSVEFKTGATIIQEGSDGSLVYAIEEGSVQISKNERNISTMGPGKIFGELAILYNCVRTASVKAVSDCKLWAINRREFQTIMVSNAVKKEQQYLTFLQSVPAFKDLKPDILSKIVDALDQTHYENGEYIIRQGQPGDMFYIITKGKVNVTQEASDSSELVVLREQGVGDFFGERALETEETRSANVIASDPDGVICLVLERIAYKTLISKSGFQPPVWQTARRSTERISVEIPSVKALTDLKFVATLGIGGFGRVELVNSVNDTKRSFALKKLKKQHIVATKQQDHIMNEKKILMETECHFIIRLFGTFKDKKYLYMVMEVALGGELWSLLRDKGSFDINQTRFYSACVTEALGHLHSRGIVYRDLKPENIVIDDKGYAKLIDFGFAKYIGAGGRTYTFCGTPEYVAPEVILNRGHGMATDLWSFGILVYELLAGSAPFSGSDHMKTYNLILKGIEFANFPKNFNKTAFKLVKQLCRDNPTERLGYDTGMKSIQKHKWFEGFNWEGLRKRTMKAPYIPKVKNCLDSTNFDDFPKDDSVPDDDETGWDKDF